jgi:hypothetical protein
MNYRFTPGSVISSVVGALSFVAYLLFHFDVVAVTGVWPYYVAVGIFLLAGVWWAWDVRFHHRHQRAMAQFAHHVEGWTYAPATNAYRNRMLAFPFGTGRERRDVDVVYGPFSGLACASFTHQYVEGKEDEIRVPRSWQIDCVDLPYPLATIDIVPDDALAKFEKLLGGQDIDFESAAFNARWRVKAGNAKYAHDVVHPRLMERLLKPDALGIAIRIEGDVVYGWAADRRGPQDLARRLGVLTAIARLIPEFVYREFKEIHDRAEAAARKRMEQAPDWAKTPYALSSGRYTELGKEEWARRWQPDYADEDWRPEPDAPPEDPNRETRG